MQVQSVEIGSRQEDPSPVLSAAAGTYFERAPHPVLRKHFHRTWFNAISPAKARPIAVAPDGFADLQWVDGILRIAGPDRAVNIESIAPGTLVIGFRFQPAALRHWLRIDASELVGARVPLESFWGGEARRLAAWAGEARSPEAISERIEKELAKKASLVREPEAWALEVFEVVASNASGSTNITRHLGAAIDLCERTLRRRCERAFGYGPKTLQRVFRLRQFLAAVSSARPEARLADLAAEIGYADQAHLAREAREMTGLTPKMIVRQLRG